MWFCWYQASGLIMMSSAERSPASTLREQDAVVVGVRLVAEDGDAEFRRVLENLLQAGDSGHAVTDYDQIFHVMTPCEESENVGLSPGFFHVYGALLEIRFAGDRVEGALRDEVRIGLREMEGHEDLAGCDDFGDAQFHAASTRLRFEMTLTRSWGFRCRRWASRGFISSQARGDMPSRIGTARVLVRVCQCSTVRPVFRMKG